MEAHVKARLEAYRPQVDKAVWKRIRPVVLALVERAQPATEHRAVSIAAAVIKYVVWVEEKKLGIDPANLLDEKVLEWFLSDAEFSSGATEDTYASALRRVLANGTTRKPARSQRYQLSEPYTGEEQAAMLALAECQPTEAFSVKVESLLRLGLGAGARPEELRYVQPADIFERHGEICVRLGVSGDKSREVPVLRAHGRRLVALAAKAVELELPYLVSGHGSPDSDNTLSHLYERMNGGSDAPRIQASRLRTTWLVTQLRARTPLDVLLAVSGEGTAARLAELLEYVPELDPETAAAILAGAGSDEGNGGRR